MWQTWLNMGRMKRVGSTKINLDRNPLDFLLPLSTIYSAMYSLNWVTSKHRGSQWCQPHRSPVEWYAKSSASYQLLAMLLQCQPSSARAQIPRRQATCLLLTWASYNPTHCLTPNMYSKLTVWLDWYHLFQERLHSNSEIPPCPLPRACFLPLSKPPVSSSLPCFRPIAYHTTPLIALWINGLDRTSSLPSKRFFNICS